MIIFYHIPFYLGNEHRDSFEKHLSVFYNQRSYNGDDMCSFVNTHYLSII